MYGPSTSGSDSAPHTANHARNSACTTNDSVSVMHVCGSALPDKSSSDSRQYHSGNTTGT